MRGHTFGIISNWRRCWKRSTILSSIILTSLAVATAAGSLLAMAAAATFPIVGQPFTNVNGITNFCLGAGFGAICVLGLISTRIISDDFYDMVHDSFTSRDVAGGLDWPKTIFSFLLTFGVISMLPILTLIILSLSPITEGGYLDIASWSFGALTAWLKDYAGGPVGFFVSAISLSGFILTVRQLRDFNERVMSFEDLIQRVSRLSKSATNHDPLCVISYTPALGFLAQPKYQSVEWIDFLTNKQDGQRRVRIITLKQDDLEKWHEQFIGRRTSRGILDQEDITECNNTCAEIKRQLGSKHYREVAQITSRLVLLFH